MDFPIGIEVAHAGRLTVIVGIDAKDFAVRAQSEVARGDGDGVVSIGRVLDTLGPQELERVVARVKKGVER